MSGGDPGRAGASGEAVLLFDGLCPLCSGSVRFLARRDPARRLRYATLASPAARRLLAARGVPPPPAEADTVLLLDAEGAHARSEAVLRALGRLRQPWPRWAALLRRVPRAWRDAAYAAVARRRRRWFGRRERCEPPSPDLDGRFLEDGIG